MKTEELRYLSAFAECGSMREAARRCQIDRSTMSRCIARFEKEFHAQLFVETPAGLKQTDRGQRALKIVREILAIQDRLLWELQQPEPLFPQLRLALEDSLEISAVEPLLLRLKESLPDLPLSLHQKRADEWQSALQLLRLDAVLAPQELKKDGLTFLSIQSDPLLLLYPKGQSSTTLYAPACLRSAAEKLSAFETLEWAENAAVAQLQARLNQSAVLIFQSQMVSSMISWQREYPELRPRKLGWLIQNKEANSPIINLLKEVFS